MTEAELVEVIKSNLGAPVMCLEFDTTHYDTIVRNAKRWFIGKKGLIGAKAVSISDGQVIKFSQLDPTYGVYKILDVYFDIDPQLATMYYECFYDIYPFGVPLLFGASNYLTVAGQYSAFAQMIMSLEQRRRVFGSEPDWFVEPAIDGDNDFYVDGIHNRAASILVIYKPNVKPETMPLSMLHGRDELMITEYATAEAKEILGRIRGKYRSYPAAGGTVDTDSDALLDEARTMKERLEEEISGSQGPIGFISG